MTPPEKFRAAANGRCDAQNLAWLLSASGPLGVPVVHAAPATGPAGPAGAEETQHLIPVPPHGAAQSQRLRQLLPGHQGADGALGNAEAAGELPAVEQLPVVAPQARGKVP